jgi:uncharacterized repeat protein (TIGR01451 family)
MEVQHTIADATIHVVANPLLLQNVSPAATNLHNMGDTFSYTITVSDIGTLSLTSVEMSNAIPSELTADDVFYGRGSSDIEDTDEQKFLLPADTGRTALRRSLPISNQPSSAPRFKTDRRDANGAARISSEDKVNSSEHAPSLASISVAQRSD